MTNDTPSTESSSSLPQSGNSNSNSNTATTQFGDQFTLTPADQPNLQLSSFLLDKTNWTSWKIDVEQTLIIKSKIGFINGNISPPNLDDASYMNWKRIDCLVLKWLRNSILPEIGRQFIHNSTARTLWLELEDSYGKTSGPRVLALKKRIVNLVQGDNSVTSYYTDLKSLWKDYRALNPFPANNLEVLSLLNKADDKEMLLQFLSGLNDDHSPTCNQILLMSPLPTVSKAHGMLVDVESQNETQGVSGGNSTANFALAISEKSTVVGNTERGRPTCTYCKKVGHTKEKCYQLANKNAYCEHCKRNGHSKTNCFKITGIIPDWYKAMKEGQKTKLIAGAAVTTTGSSETQSVKSTNSDASTSLEARLAKIEELLTARGTRGNGMSTPFDLAGGIVGMTGPEL